MINPINSNYWYYSYLPILFENPNNTMPYMTNLLPEIYTPQIQLNDFVNTAGQLSEIVNSIQDYSSIFEGENSVFQKRTLSISDENVTGTVKPGATIASYDIRVSQIAESQRNEGNWMNVTNLDFSTGDQSFEISIGGNSYTFNINVSSSDTNLSVLEKMAEAVNQADIGVNANVEISNDQARIVLQSEKTGTNYSFTVKDVSGNLISTSGASSIVQNAQNLVYSVNGGPYEQSQQNTLNLDNGNVTLTFNGMPQNGEVTIKVGYDTPAIKQAVENMVNDVNRLADFVYENKDNLSDMVVSSVDSLLNNVLIQNIGIERQGNELVITDRFNELLNDENKIGPVIQTSLSNFANTLDLTLQNLKSFSSVNLLNTGGYQGFNYSLPEYSMLTKYYSYNLLLSYYNLNLYG